MTNFEKDTDVQVRQRSTNFTGISLAIAAAILIVGAFDMTPNKTEVVQNNTALPPPV